MDEFSNYPPTAPLVPGLSGWSPNVESIAEYEPDLVVMSDNSVAEELRTLGIEVLVQSATGNLQGVYDQIIEMGEATGNTENAQTLVANMSAEVAELVATAAEQSASASGQSASASGQQTYFHELDDTLYSVSSQTFIGYLYSLAGLINIADGNTAAGGNAYPQLSAEYVLAADPDYIFFADGPCCDQTAETIAARPGWENLTAVQNGRVIEMNADIASRWGPRSVDFLAVIVKAVS